MSFEVEDNIPIPPRVGRGSGIWSTADKLEIGQSFAIDASLRPNVLSLGTLAKKKNKKFTTRSLVENGKKIIRIWRTE